MVWDLTAILEQVDATQPQRVVFDSLSRTSHARARSVEIPAADSVAEASFCGQKLHRDAAG
jgi:hypothetical protein